MLKTHKANNFLKDFWAAIPSFQSFFQSKAATQTNFGSKYRAELVAVLFCFLLFFLDFINLFSLKFYQKLIFSWKEKNHQILQQLAKPIDRFSYLWNLTSRIEDLQYRYAESSAELSRLKDLEVENQNLRKMLENSDRSLDKTVIATPIVSFSQPVLAVGSDDGLRDGSAVFYEGNLLGFLRDVQESNSRVELLNQMTDFGILVETETGVKALVKGDGRNILLTEVASDQQLELNQMVKTVGQEGITAGLYVGRIRNIREKNKAESTQTAEIEQLIDFYKLGLVEVK
jgi:cell shape-determining protein MreC